MKKRKCVDMPEHLWPPINAEEKEVVAFRATQKSGVVTSEDFLSSYDKDKKNGRIRSQYLGQDGYYALSVFEDENDARNLIRKFPQFFKDISTGITRFSDGCIRRDPSMTGRSHDNWWLYEGAEPEKYFEILKEGLDEK